MALVLASGASAQGADDQQKPVLSVWRISDVGAEHLQSGLDCPSQFRSYRRIDLHVYDQFGLDISCNYLDRAASDVTVYLTRRAGTSADDSMAEAKREFLQVRAAMHPQPIAETHPTVAGLAWDLALYSVDGGMRDAIWIADLDGWTLEYRVTYRADAEAQVTADMDAFVVAARASAGARLDLCAKSTPPDRTGALSRGHANAEADALMGAIVDAAAQSAARDAGDAEPTSQSILWCADEPMPGQPLSALLWRGVREDGSDAKADRVTAMTIEAPVALVAAENSTEDIVRRESGGPAGEWEATTSQGGKTSIWGYFTGRPKPDALAALYADILAGKAHPLSTYAVNGKQISIGVAPAKK